MKGHVHKRGKPGSWAYVVELGTQPAQRCTECNKRFWLERKPLEKCPACAGELNSVEERRQKTQAGFRTQRDAQDAMDKVKVAIAENLYVAPSKTTLKEYLIDEWLPAIKTTVRPTTYASHNMLIEQHVVPRLGGVQLRRLNAPTINAHYAHLLEKGKVRGEGGLSPASVRRVHAVMHRALRDAVRWQRLPHNPADAADPPKASAEHNEREVWTREELHKFLKAVKEDTLYPVWLLLMTTGMRRGEALGLQWQDLDLEKRKLSVRRALVNVNGDVQVSEPKTKRGRRTLSLDPGTVQALKARRVAQKQERLAKGNLWQKSDYVFTDELGRTLDPTTVTKSFQEAVRSAKLKHIRLHDLRHTYATLALAGGMNARDLSARLGHSTVAITLDIYSHGIPSFEQEMAEQVAALIIPAT
jgi:integrase